MALLIDHSFKLMMHSLVTPTGKDWYADEATWVAGVRFENEISSLFPYLNAVLEKAVYLDQPTFIRFHFEGTVCALHPDYLAAFPFADRKEAGALVGRLVDFLNDLHGRRSSVQPNYKTHNPIAVPKILKLLPLTNCRRCDYTTCMAFAGAVRTGRAVLQQCPEISTPMIEKAIYAVHDDQGNVVDKIDVEIDTAQVGNILAQQRSVIKSLEKKVTLLERQPQTHPTYEPPFGIELSPREIEVLRLIAHGSTNTEISELLLISTHTVKSHVTNIFNKLGVNDRTQAAVWAARNGIV